jgi:THO complex subunit 4
LTPAASGPGPRARNPFDTAVRPPRPLADRISIPGGTRSRSRSPVRHSDVSGLAPEGVDRYVPGQGGRRSRSPLPRRREGRRPGDRRERGERRGGGRDMGRQGGRDGGRDGGARTVRRPAKTQEELDAEMDDYFNNGTGKDTASAGAVAAEPAPQDGGDVDMIE